MTPGAQVHRGSLAGEPVAVKVLRPGLAASVRQDMALLELLAGPLGSAFPGVDPAAATREFRDRVLEELDLEHEAEVQRRFHRALRGHPFLSVPSPVMRLCHESVLVSEWADGASLWDAPDPDRAAARLVAFGIGAAVTLGVSHADLHPDNVLVGTDGGLTILDFGATRRVDRERVAARDRSPRRARRRRRRGARPSDGRRWAGCRPSTVRQRSSSPAMRSGSSATPGPRAWTPAPCSPRATARSSVPT